MCGIAGIWHLNNAPLTNHKLQKFTDAMQHRGPDGAGYYIDDAQHLGLGHRRLSILDLSDAGKQPMAFAEDRYWITFNGEIYNFIELRKELQQAGYHFKTDTDTEVLLSAYHLWGKACMSKFNGMWAFAIWDKQEQSLFLARDRFGVKPLHYLHLPAKLFAFASETIAFKHLDDFNRQIDAGLLQRAMLDSNKVEAAGYTLFENIVQLAAGCYILLKKDKPVVQQRWWNTFDHLQTVPAEFTTQVQQFKDLFEDACRLRLRSDVPLASALSGGVDSSAVYCMINHLMKNQDQALRTPQNWQKAFSATFPGAPNDERKFAEEVVAYTKGDAVYITPDYKNLAEDIVRTTVTFDAITGTPLVAVSDVYKAMRAGGITVSMDGHGADELMYGYRSSVSEAYFEAALSQDHKNEKDLLDTFTQMFVEGEQQRASQRLVARGKEVVSFERGIKNQNALIKNAKLLIKNYLSAGRISYMEKLSPGAWFNHAVINVPAALKNNRLKFPALGRAELRLANDFHIDHIPYNLRDFDRASMQHGIEIRMPFMDYRLVTYLFSLPLESKLGQGYTKRILRNAMQGLMPESIRLRRTKIGLSAPITQWFNTHLNEFVSDQVNSESFRKSPYWNGELIRNMAEEKTRSKTWTDAEALPFWNVLNAHIILSNDNRNSI
jgi:asparagine synthase (glutamine-hydrolysing)